MREIPLTRGYVAFVDEADYARVVAAGPWHVRINKVGGMTYAVHTGFVKGSMPYKWTKLLMHRFILGITNPKIDVDHRNRYGLDNRKQNLRTATRSQNCANKNRPRVRFRTSSKYKGICWNKKLKKWAAKITVNGKQMHLGLFADESLAAQVRDAYARHYLGDFAKLNLSKRKG